MEGLWAFLERSLPANERLWAPHEFKSAFFGLSTQLPDTPPQHERHTMRPKPCTMQASLQVCVSAPYLATIGEAYEVHKPKGGKAFSPSFPQCLDLLSLRERPPLGELACVFKPTTSFCVPPHKSLSLLCGFARRKYWGLPA